MEKKIINRIQSAINYIEEHIYEKIEIEDIAKMAFMSQSSFYKIFSEVFNTTVKDYIRKRRLSLSAYDLLQSNLSILDIALKYQYHAYESYSRSFKRLFGISPKQYREKNLYTNVFPRVTLNFNNLIGGPKMVNKEMNKELIVKKLNSLSKGYILDIDIDHFQKINDDYGYKIGDKVLVEIPSRIKMVLKKYNLDVEVTRINADEFAVILKDKSKDFVIDLSKEIINAMKSDFIFGDVKLDVTVSIGISDFSVDKEDEEILKSVRKAMILAKENGRNQFMISK
ncbi:diguanylate cyclase domain-containing protein [Sporosalibacterium faouarense]|uniref:diguanylate cyclase domain-containing protein n=1 Tax=Sporosalibacterium faouarense TaxID=516123 RepID=UPI00192B7ECC|nr:diguanylate cyclase [Sporosalibacterium faouarense]